MQPDQLSLQQMVKYFLYGTLIVVGLGLIYFWLSFGAATITVIKNDNIQSTTEIKAVRTDGSEDGMLHIGNFYFIPRSSHTIKVAADKYTTLLTVKSLPYFGSSTYSVSLFKDKNALKVASDAPGCLSYGEEGKRVVSYSCSSPEYMLHFNPSTWANTEVAGIAKNTFAIAPYRAGIAGILLGQETESPIFVISAQGDTSYIKKPETLKTEELATTSILTDASSRSSHFVLKTKSGTIYYYGDDGNYKKMEAPSGYNAKFDSMLCSLVSKALYCYYGPSGDSGDSSEEIGHIKNNPTGHLETYNLSSGERTNTPLEGKGIDSFTVTRSGHIYGLERGSLYSLKEPNQEPQRLLIHTDVGSISANEELYFSKGDAIYKSKDFQSYKVFSSDNVRLSSIFAIDNAVLFNGYLKKEAALNTQTLHTFHLTDASNDGKVRLLDVFPLNPSTYLVSSDFYQKEVRLQIQASIISDRQKGTTTVDPDEFRNNKASAAQALKALGIKPEEYVVTYTN